MFQDVQLPSKMKVFPGKTRIVSSNLTAPTISVCKMPQLYLVKRPL
jgi:hypothetical protein